MPVLFPTEIRATCFGIVNVFARFTTILSPIIAEAPEPAPMLIYGGLATICCFGSLCLRNSKEVVNRSDEK
jgi:hypothetical protein